MKELESSVREEVTRTYTEVLFDKLAEVGDGMQEAADGSGELKDGADQLADGNRTITDNLQILSKSALVFADGSQELEVGLDQYTDGVSTAAAGAEELQNGVNCLLYTSSDTISKPSSVGFYDFAMGRFKLFENVEEICSTCLLYTSELAEVQKDYQKLSGEKEILQGLADRYNRLLRMLGKDMVEKLVQDDIRMQEELEVKKHKEQIPKKISDRIPVSYTHLFLF